MNPPTAKAQSFRSMHHGPTPLVLPNAWDVASARLFEDAGFPAVATSSAGVMVSHGHPDGESMPWREYATAVASITERLSVPVSADIVSGYGSSLRAVRATVRSVIRAGAVGINLEDLRPAGHGLFSATTQVARVRAVRAAADSVGVPLVINARTDALRNAPGTPSARFKEAVRRARLYRDAGADCVYPMGLSDAARIADFVARLEFPVNVMVRPGLPALPELARLGVKRVSFGPAASYATLGLLRRASAEIQTRGTFRLLTEGALTFDELNYLARPPTG
ncbi:MAG: isocitrate lyase/phosphoenolpyruvate mutase family protein [Thermoplasmata archaeon]